MRESANLAAYMSVASVLCVTLCATQLHEGSMRTALADLCAHTAALHSSDVLQSACNRSLALLVSECTNVLVYMLTW
jgi:hypothetical protein